ncbi:hypothetical protein J6590_036652 [Homalodisca vitripennis]|nr:hypothetical protein J6590_036652 [Homalodisca vitripennis]
MGDSYENTALDTHNVWMVELPPPVYLQVRVTVTRTPPTCAQFTSVLPLGRKGVRLCIHRSHNGDEKQVLFNAVFNLLLPSLHGYLGREK